MGQSFYGGTDAAVDYTNPYLPRNNDYYRNPYGVYHQTVADAERR